MSNTVWCRMAVATTCGATVTGQCVMRPLEQCHTELPCDNNRELDHYHTAHHSRFSAQTSLVVALQQAKLPQNPALPSWTGSAHVQNRTACHDLPHNCELTVKRHAFPLHTPISLWAACAQSRGCLSCLAMFFAGQAATRAGIQVLGRLRAARAPRAAGHDLPRVPDPCALPLALCCVGVRPRVPAPQQLHRRGAPGVRRVPRAPGVPGPGTRPPHLPDFACVRSSKGGVSVVEAFFPCVCNLPVH